MKQPGGFRVVIPARFGSTRLPGKVLLPLLGKPLLAHVWQRACESQAEQVVIATDDARVLQLAQTLGADVEMTDAGHASGSDRVNEVAARRGWVDTDVVVNLQGDEPAMPAQLIDQLGQVLLLQPQFDMATLAFPLTAVAAYLDPNQVKVVFAADGQALYFSRAPIPCERAAVLAGKGHTQLPAAGSHGHIGLYAYRVGALRQFSQLPASALEHCEGLEQLRALENGLRMHVGLAASRPGRGVDTAADVAVVEAQLRALARD